MRDKSMSEYLDFASTFPTAIAEAMGNGWTPQDVVRVVKEIRLLTLTDDPLTSDNRPEVSFGAINPNELQ